MSDVYRAHEPGLYSVKEFSETEVDPMSGCIVHTTSQVRRPKPKFDQKHIEQGIWHPGMEVWETKLDASRWPVPFGDHDLDSPYFEPHWEEEVENEGF